MRGTRYINRQIRRNRLGFTISDFSRRIYKEGSLRRGFVGELRTGTLSSALRTPEILACATTFSSMKVAFALDYARARERGI